MGTASIARGVIGGIAGAAGDPQTQQEMALANQQAAAQKQNELKAKIAPLGLAIKNLQSGIQGAYSQYQQANPNWQGDFDAWKTGPGAQQFGQFVDQTQHAVHSMREILHPDHQAGPTDWLKTHLTDRMHISNADHRAEDQANDQAWNKFDEGQFTQTAANKVQPNPLSPQEQTQAAKIKAGLTPKDTTEQERFVTDYQKRNPGATPEQALGVFRDATSTAATKAPKGLDVMDKGGVFLGVKDQDTGVQYLPSQLSPNGNAPPEAKQMWQSVQEQKAQKLAEERRKEDESLLKQSRTIAAAFDRMGAQQAFQENMAQFRTDLTEHRKLSDLADQSEETVNALKEQYKQPGNKAVADNELQNFYTSVVQKGGRKTAAELALTLKIGSWGMNIDTMMQKAKTGELPDGLRRDLLHGMEAVANEQKRMAEERKPELPEITSPSGAKHKQLQKTRQGQSGGKSLADRLNDALQ